MTTATDSLHILAFEHAPIGLVMTESRIIRACNPAFAEMFGYCRDELIDQSFAILYPSQEEFVRIRDVGVEPLKKTNRYSDERIMKRRGDGGKCNPSDQAAGVKFASRSSSASWPRE